MCVLGHWPSFWMRAWNRGLHTRTPLPRVQWAGCLSFITHLFRNRPPWRDFLFSFFCPADRQNPASWTNHLSPLTICHLSRRCPHITLMLVYMSSEETEFKYQLNPLKCLPLWVFGNLAVFFLRIPDRVEHWLCYLKEIQAKTGAEFITLAVILQQPSLWPHAPEVV